MDYQDITRVDQQTMARSSLKELEAQHFQVCIQITANKGIKGNDPRELEQRKSAIELGLRNLRREYAALLAEPVEDAETEPLTEEELAALERAQTNSIMDVVDHSMITPEPQRNGHEMVTVD